MFNGFAYLLKHKQKILFLIVGAYNTLFSLVFGNLCYYFLKLPYPIITAIIYIVSILNSYFNYEFFVFKTKQNISKGLSKASLSYLGAFLINLLLMFICIDLLNMNRITAFNIVSVIVVTLTYFLHKNFTYKA